MRYPRERSSWDKRIAFSYNAPSALQKMRIFSMVSLAEPPLHQHITNPCQQNLKHLWLPSRPIPDIASFLLTGLCSWFLDPGGFELLHHTSDEYTFIATTEQIEYGWFALLYAYLSKTIVSLHHQLLSPLDHRVTGSPGYPCFNPNCGAWYIPRVSGLALLKTSIDIKYTKVQDLWPPP